MDGKTLHSVVAPPIPEPADFDKISARELVNYAALIKIIDTKMQ